MITARKSRRKNLLRETDAAGASDRKIYRAGGYARLSVEDGGNREADTMKNQEEIILKYIEAQPDMKFMGMYCDNGQTGTNFARPRFERLLQEVREGKINCIVVKDLSRFGRNYLETGNYLERIFPFLGVRFVAITDGYDTAKEGGTDDTFTVPLKNIVNEAYSRDISKKIGSALKSKQQRGEFIGTWAAYGYKKCEENPRRIEPDPETAPVVREIFGQRLLGASYGQIAEELNRQEIPSPARYHYLKGDSKAQRSAGAVWKTSTIKNILSNELYLGHMVQGRRRSSFYEGKKQQRLPAEEWVIVRNTHAPLVTEKEFQKAQKLAEGQEKRPGDRRQMPCPEKEDNHLSHEKQ